MPVHRFPETPFTTRQAAALGVDSKSLTLLVRERILVRLFTGVYLLASVEPTTEVRAEAARLVMNSHSVICDRTAAWLLGAEVLRYAELDTVPPLDTFVLRGHDPTDRRDCHGGTRDLRPGDWTMVGRVRVTTPLRTAMDLGCRLPRRRALAAMDALMRLYGFTRRDMERMLPRYFRRRGVVQLRQLIPLVDARSESARESWTRLEILDRGLPAPELQFWVTRDGVLRYRLDLAYPRARIAVEYDGEDFHTSPEARARDEERRAWLRSRGWRIIVLTKESFASPAAVDGWIAELCAHLAAC